MARVRYLITNSIRGLPEINSQWTFIAVKSKKSKKATKIYAGQNEPPIWYAVYYAFQLSWENLTNKMRMLDFPIFFCQTAVSFSRVFGLKNPNTLEL